MNWLVDEPPGPFRARVKIRYNHAGADGLVHVLSRDRVRVEFDEPQPAVTPGQVLVMYDGDAVLGGGWIER